MNHSASDRARQSWLPAFARWASVLVMALGGVVLLGWAAGIHPFHRLFPHNVRMNSVSAVLFILAGFSLWRQVSSAVIASEQPSGDRLARWLAVVVIVVGIAKLFDYIAGMSGSITIRLIPQSLQGTQIAPNASLNFLLCGLALLLMDWEVRPKLRVAQALAAAAGLIALLALVGYTYKVFLLYRVRGAIPMSLESAFAFAVFSLGFLAARPDRGIMELITSPTTAGAVVRRLLPTAILIPWGLGGLLLMAEERETFHSETAISLFAVCSIVIFAGLIWWHAKLLYRADLERANAEVRLREATRNLERSNSDLQDFAYVASHDLLEPLRMVTSYLDLLKDQAKGKLDPRAEEFVSFALDGAHRMRALINDLLAYSRLEIRTPGLERISSEEVLQAALSNLKVAIEESGAIITHEPLPMVLADRVQLTQVFQNFIGNAIKFRGAKPVRVQVGAERQNGDWVFSVRDNGIGIDPKFFERIFVIFQRLHTRQEYAGTGIGLAICKKIIERLGGRVWVESALGKGSSFLFTLPVLAGVEAPQGSG